MNDLVFRLSLQDLTRSFANGELSPIDLAEACIAQVEALDARLDAWEVFDAEKLRRDARASHERIRETQRVRPLEGIPVAVKDIFNTADFPTQMGSPLWKGFTPGNDARALFHLQRQGALVPGKTTTAEFAVHTLGNTKNPHDVGRTPGTSSSGSAVAICAGMAPVALGTQTAGSIIRPASFCGVYGCKPSFGLIPRMGMLKTTDSLDTVGYFTVHYSDLETVFEALRVHGRNYPISDRALAQDKESLTVDQQKPWKVAYLIPEVLKNAPTEALDALAQWAKRLSEQNDIEVTLLDNLPQLKPAHRIHATIYNKSLSYYFQGEYQKAELVSPIMNRLIEEGLALSPADYQAALREQEDFAKSVDSLLAPFDIAFTLSTAGAAPLRETVESPDSALIWTLSHLPVISAPVFQTSEGLPFGLQLMSRRYCDYRLFKFCDTLIARELLPTGPSPLAPDVAMTAVEPV